MDNGHAPNTVTLIFRFEESVRKASAYSFATMFIKKLEAVSTRSKLESLLYDTIKKAQILLVRIVANKELPDAFVKSV